MPPELGWHLWEIDLTFAPGFPPGWLANCIGTVEQVTAYDFPSAVHVDLAGV